MAEGRVRLVDGTLISCANYPGCASHSAFAEHASYGYCPSKSQFVWGMRRREYRSSMELVEIELVTPDKHRLGERPASEVLFSASPSGCWPLPSASMSTP